MWCEVRRKRVEPAEWFANNDDPAMDAALATYAQTRGMGVAGLLMWVFVAQAQVACEGGVSHASLGGALADPACSELRLDAGVLREEVAVRRSVSITGAGTASTWLVCDEGPCLSVLPGVVVELRELTVAAEGTTLAAWHAQLSVEDVVITRVGRRGGFVRLRNSNAWFDDVDVDVSEGATIQIEALSTRGHDVAFETARFFGKEPESGTKSAIYTIGYSVDCTHCSFGPERERPRPPEPLWALDDAPVTPGAVHARTARWPQLSCPVANAEHRARCREQCAEDEEVATCRMNWEDKAGACHPVAVCVPVGEADVDVPSGLPERASGSEDAR